MTVDIAGNLNTYCKDRPPELRDFAPKSRHASLDYPYNYFQEGHEEEDTARLADEKHLQLSCLQLSF